ncbi:MAG TPA: LysR family transcriptional regulator [Acetobacteraceae bacterium]|jgi:putative oxidoreductase|nr:LysR family transcriptional regulator [Acetobacteraceae bacterium]
MIDNRTAPYAATLLRLTLGAAFLSHAALKIFVFTPAGTAHFFESVGVPGFVAYLTMLGEAAGGLALIAGEYTRIVALALTPILLGTIATVHGHNGFFFHNPNGGWEYPAFWIVALVVQALLGDGAFAVGSPLLQGARGRAVAAE